MAFGSVLRGLGRIASYGMAPTSAMTPPTFAGSPYDPSEFSGEPYDPEYATTGIPAAIPPTPKPKPLSRLDTNGVPQQEAPEAKSLALPPPKRLDAREEFANIGAPPLPGDYRSGAYRPPSIKRQLLGGLLRMTPVVNATNIPEDVEAPGYRQKAMEYKGNVETAARRAALQNEKEGRAIQEETRATANKQLQRQEERDRLIDQDRDRAAKQAVLDRLPPGSEVVDAPVPNDPDHTYRKDDFDRVLKIPTPAKLARDKKEAEQVNWLPVPKNLQQEFGLPERAPEQTLRMVVNDLERRQQHQEAMALQKSIADQNDATRRLAISSRPVNNFIIPGMPGGAGGVPGAVSQPSTPASGEEFLKTLPAGVSNQIRRMIDGDMQIPSATSRAPAAQQLRLALSQADPMANEQRFKVRTAYRDNKQNTPGGSINSANTVVDHIGVLAQLADEMKNNPIQAQNRLVNWVQTQLGHPEVTNAATATNAVANEMERLMRQAGTSDAGIQSFKKGLSLIETSPDQAKGQIATTLKILGGRVGELANSYQRGMGRDQTDSDRSFVRGFLSPQARQTLTKFGINADEMLNVAGNSPAQPGLRREQHSQSTGQYRHTLDGGKTWQPGRLPQ